MDSFVRPPVAFFSTKTEIYQIYRIAPIRSILFFVIVQHQSFLATFEI